MYKNYCFCVIIVYLILNTKEVFPYLLIDRKMFDKNSKYKIYALVIIVLIIVEDLRLPTTFICPVSVEP